MIELIVFDLGGVILPFDHRQISIKLNKRSKAPSKYTSEFIFQSLFNKEDGLVNPYEEGLISTMDFYFLIREKFELDLNFEEFKEIWDKIFEEDERTKEIIHALKKRGYPLFLLSNTNEMHFSYIMNFYPIVHYFEEWILSFEVGAKKPKREIFEKIFERIDVKPESTLYIDDIIEYVNVASMIGMKGFHFSGPHNLYKFLKELKLLK